MLAIAACALAMAGLARAAEPFDGRWVADPAACASEQPAVWPLVVTSQWLTWPGAACMVGTSYRVQDAWHIGARCWGEGVVSNVPIRLRIRGDRLVLDWGRARAEELRRCPQGVTLPSDRR
jgi:hypothetical protein